mmetsp:Transcript_21937/g.54185  ORF Transcript_21937/g.54185 Transcript_21937/m.54185 type:complete len:205 (-) Transcript_21937:1631-2245(-)
MNHPSIHPSIHPFILLIGQPRQHSCTSSSDENVLWFVKIIYFTFKYYPILLVHTSHWWDRLALIFIQSVIVNGSISQTGALAIKVRQSMFHPFFIVTVGSIFTSMSTPRFLAVFRTRNRSGSTGQQILEFQSLDQIRIPNQGLICHLNIVIELVDNGIDHDLSCLQGIIVTVNGRMFLHGHLKFVTNFGSGSIAGRISQGIQIA